MKILKYYEKSDCDKNEEKRKTKETMIQEAKSINSVHHKTRS